MARRERRDASCSERRLFVVEGEEALEFFFVRLFAVFADLEGFGVFEVLAAVFAVPFNQFFAKAIGLAGETAREAVTHRFGAGFFLFGIAGDEVLGTVRAAF